MGSARCRTTPALNQSAGETRTPASMLGGGGLRSRIRGKAHGVEVSLPSRPSAVILFLFHTGTLHKLLQTRIAAAPLPGVSKYGYWYIDPGNPHHPLHQNKAPPFFSQYRYSRRGWAPFVSTVTVIACMRPTYAQCTPPQCQTQELNILEKDQRRVNATALARLLS